MHVPASVVRKGALLAGLAAALALPAPASAEVRLRAADPLETVVVERINGIRRAHGLQPLALHSALNRAAGSHAVNMARHGYFSHSWSGGTPFAKWIRRYWPGNGRYRSWSVGENLYWRGPTINATQVVTGWMASPPHRRNLLNREWRSIGVAAVMTLDPIGAYGGVPRATVVAAEFGFRRS
jgi:uncharacterized protein YkwD